MSERKPYKTDVSDEQWALVEPVIAAWKAAHPSVSGHQGRYAMRPRPVTALRGRHTPLVQAAREWTLKRRFKWSVLRGVEQRPRAAPGVWTDRLGEGA
ncbi:hypothetical protein GCM10010317_064760 [Streptomyces mirabilis]|nr:hypothetical protein GCM10010317_064760 [Streptomyces mirabilis]